MASQSSHAVEHVACVADLPQTIRSKGKSEGGWRGWCACIIGNNKNNNNDNYGQGGDGSAHELVVTDTPTKQMATTDLALRNNLATWASSVQNAPCDTTRAGKKAVINET